MFHDVTSSSYKRDVSNARLADASCDSSSVYDVIDNEKREKLKPNIFDHYSFKPPGDAQEIIIHFSSKLRTL